jgi:hypothetical protein
VYVFIVIAISMLSLRRMSMLVCRYVRMRDSYRSHVDRQGLGVAWGPHGHVYAELGDDQVVLCCACCAVLCCAVLCAVCVCVMS